MTSTDGQRNSFVPRPRNALGFLVAICLIAVAAWAGSGCSGGGGGQAEVCTSPQVACGAACVNTQVDAAHCGACGHACATGQACVAGSCALACTSPQVACSAACVNTQTDAAHCGTCGHACPSGASCAADQCKAAACTGTLLLGGLPWLEVPALAYAVVAGDFDGDGHADLAVTFTTWGVSSSGVAVYLGRGHGLFASPVEYATGALPQEAAAVDLDHDGRLDLVTANASDGTVSVLLGKGDGTFHDRSDYPAGSAPSSLQVGDLDGDGQLDVAVANRGHGTLSVLRGKGAGSLADALTTVVEGASWVAIGDFTGDGRPDLATCSTSGAAFTVLPGKGDATFLAPLTTAVRECPSGAVGGDFDGDGKLDLVGYGGSNGYEALQVMLGKGDGTFTVGTPGEYRFWTSALALDLDQDGRTDLALTANGAGAPLSVLLGNGDGTFRAAADYDVGQVSNSTAAADLDGDGRLDLAVSGQTSQSVTLLLGKGHGLLAAPPRLDVVGSSAADVLAGDLQGDGKTDLLVATGDKVVVFLGSGGGAFGAGTSYPVSNYAGSVRLTDLNADGRPDLVAVANDKMSVLVNTGGGTFRAAVEYAVEGSTYALAAGDFDGDGRVDLVSAGAGASYDGAIQFLKGNGDGTFRAAVDTALPTHGSVSYLAAGDLDGDAKLDLVVGMTLGNPQRVVARGKGDGTFMVGESQSDYGDPRTGLLVDVDGDGKLDLVRGTSAGLTVEPGRGDGTFGPPAISGEEPVWYLALADLDGDGRLDAATTSAGFSGNHGAVQVMKGHGDGTFSTSNLFGAGTYPGPVAAADLDGDGRPDLAVVPSSGDPRLLLSTCLP